MTGLFNTRITLSQLFRGLCGLAGLAVAYGIYLVTQDYARGREALAQMCEASGGLTVYESVFATGYREAQRPGTCLNCPAEFVGKKLADFIEFESSDGARPFLEPGEYRVSLAEDSDPRCAVYTRLRERPHYSLRSPAEYGHGLDIHQCFAFERIDQPMARYSFWSRSGRVTAANGYGLTVQEWIVSELPSQRILAANRNYAFYPKIGPYLDESGGGGTQDSSCESRNPRGIVRLDDMLRRVLRDETKR